MFSVWDGDWAILEEYGQNNARLKSYLQGFHGLIKTFPDEFYYYQDSLGSTSHVADDNGNLIEYYKYDLYGKPTYWNASSQQMSYSTYGIVDLHGGQRWIPELGIYDDRNRFMSPDLGRFLQPDPIGFKGDASNLYRFVGNDWANRTDPMGLQEGTPMHDQKARMSTQEKEPTEPTLRLDFQSRQTPAGSNVARWVTVGSATLTMGSAFNSQNFSLAPRESFSASLMTAIHPPHAQAGIKSIQSVTLNSDGSHSSPAPYVGSSTFIGKFEGSSKGSSVSVTGKYPNFDITMRGHFTSRFYPVVQPIDYKVHIGVNFLSHSASVSGKRDGYPSGVLFGGGKRLYEWNQHRRGDLARPMEVPIAKESVQW